MYIYMHVCNDEYMYMYMSYNYYRCHMCILLYHNYSLQFSRLKIFMDLSMATKTFSQFHKSCNALTMKLNLSVTICRIWQNCKYLPLENFLLSSTLLYMHSFLPCYDMDKFIIGTNCMQLQNFACSCKTLHTCVCT